MLKRIQDYSQTYPFRSWFILVMALLTFNLTAFFCVPGKKNAGSFMLFTVMTFSSPTWGLIKRFSDEERRRSPMLVSEEQSFGILSLCLAFCSIGAFSVMLFSKHFGVYLSDEARRCLLMFFSVSAMLSAPLGYAGRYTRAGLWGLKLIAGWLVLIVGGGLLAGIILFMQQ